MRRRHLLATTSLIASSTVVGCLEENRSGGDPSETAPGTTTSGFIGSAEASNTPSPDHQITAVNEHDSPHEYAVTVTRAADGERVHESTRTLEPGTTEQVYNLSAANPDGIESFSITGTVDDQTETVVLETSLCYGGLRFVVDDTGTFRAIYDLC
jgi:hypothetical protein